MLTCKLDCDKEINKLWKANVPEHYKFNNTIPLHTYEILIQPYLHVESTNHTCPT